MDLYICENVFVPLRSGPTHRSEMLSQVLFGEKYSIIEQSGTWIKIETKFDDYTGWLDMDHLQHTPADGSSSGKVLNRSLLCHKNDSTKIVLEAGCEIYAPDFTAKIFSVGNNLYRASREFNKGYISTTGSLTDTAARFINSPYLWGGRTPSGIDCSGFCQLVYKIHGISIPRDSRMQAEAGKNVDFIDETKPGDLVFFDNERGRITHVGMIFSKGLVIHASGRVRIDPINQQGIYKHEKGGYSHHLKSIRSITG